MFFQVILTLILLVNITWADGEEDLEPAGDEQGTFLSVTSDALILLDLSGSMNFNPLGEEGYSYGSALSCTKDTLKCKETTGYSTRCSNGFCSDDRLPNCKVDCSRLAIAKRALFNILDNDGNNIINKADSDSMNVRIGFMRFKNGNDTGNDYTKGAIKLVTKISEPGVETGTSYSLTYCGNSTSCSSAVTKCTTGECIVGENATGGTPLASALREAKKYLDDHKAQDPSRACRQKFVIAVTDGADTYACEGDGSECQENMYKRRREVVAAAKALSNAGYRVFVIGFGSGMPEYLRNTLQWAAFHGGTDNPTNTNSGSISAYGIPSGSSYPSGISACQRDTAAEKAICYSGSSFSDTEKFKSTLYDPGYLTLSGYAFITEDADQLTVALKNAIDTIKGYTYSFTQSSIQAVRLFEENYVYEASFEQFSYDPFWIGHLKRYTICDSSNSACGGEENWGNIIMSPDWDAGEILQERVSPRTVYTLRNSSLVDFNSSNLTDTILDVSPEKTCTDLCAVIINFIRNGELDPEDAHYKWKLGDIFHSSPMSIATPNINFLDIIDTNSLENKGFYKYMISHKRTSANGKRIILVGANDGQLHAFKAGEKTTGGGMELWSFIPPNLLPRLKNIVHNAHPTNLTHEYYVDGLISASEIWIGGNQTSKSDSEWKTYLVISEGRGGINTLWSKSEDCSSDFSPYYKVIVKDPTSGAVMTTTYGHYCGYYAFDISDTSSAPIYKWKLGGNSTIQDGDAVYLGQSWGKMVMGRISLNGIEKWVGFMGGGYSGTNCATGGTCDTRGKGFFVVDLSNGMILKSFTRESGNVMGRMNYDLAGSPAVVDTDRDGFVDTAYVGDTGGNMWRFKFCMRADGASCNQNKWTGGMLFNNH
jgi:hypothetical protein